MKAALTQEKVLLELDRETDFEPLLALINLALGAKLRSANRVAQAQELAGAMLMALADAVVEAH